MQLIFHQGPPSLLLVALPSQNIAADPLFSIVVEDRMLGVKFRAEGPSTSQNEGGAVKKRDRPGEAGGSENKQV